MVADDDEIAVGVHNQGKNCREVTDLARSCQRHIVGNNLLSQELTARLVQRLQSSSSLAHLEAVGAQANLEAQ